MHLLRLDQHLARGGFNGDGDAEERSEGGVPSAAVEAKDELVEVGSQVLATQAVVDDVAIVAHAGRAGVSGPPVGLGGGAGLRRWL